MPVKQLADANTDGTVMGQSATDLIAMYGATPVSRRASAVQATSAISASTFATIGSNLAAALTEIFNTLQATGLWKGAA